jgi:hypothetical protein
MEAINYTCLGLRRQPVDRRACMNLGRVDERHAGGVAAGEYQR